jgi:hypothetical protein
VLLIEWRLKFGDDICMNQDKGVVILHSAFLLHSA